VHTNTHELSIRLDRNFDMIVCERLWLQLQLQLHIFYITHTLSLSLSYKVASSILERVREVLHMEPEARESVAVREKKVDEQLVEVEVFDSAVHELIDVFKACGIEAIFDAVHVELGVETVRGRTLSLAAYRHNWFSLILWKDGERHVKLFLNLYFLFL
jgi:hypothetical protein